MFIVPHSTYPGSEQEVNHIQEIRDSVQVSSHSVELSEKGTLNRALSPSPSVINMSNCSSGVNPISISIHFNSHVVRTRVSFWTGVE